MSVVRIDVLYLVNVKTEDGIKVQAMTKNIDPQLLFGDDAENVAQINCFFTRFEWQPETPIEFHPRPYWGM